MRYLPLFLFLAACGLGSEIAREDYAETAAGVWCDRLRECARGEFERAWFGLRDCRAGVAIDLELIARAAEDIDCVYRPGAAADAVQALEAMSCDRFYAEEYVEDFDALWDCPGE